MIQDETAVNHGQICKNYLVKVEHSICLYSPMLLEWNNISQCSRSQHNIPQRRQ